MLLGELTQLSSRLAQTRKRSLKVSLIAEALRHLSEQERAVIGHRFGMTGGPALTLKEIGELMDISRERVRQIECQAKSRLRKIFGRRLVVKAPPKSPFRSRSV